MTSARQLIVMLGNRPLLTSAVTRATWKIGRLPDNDLVLPDASVSQHHAEIRIEAERAFLTDLQSEGGTLASGAHIMPLQPHLLVNGATFRIGPYQIIYRSQIDAAAVEEPKAAAPDVPAETAVAAEPAAAPAVPFARRGPVPPERRPNGAGATSQYLDFLPVIFQDNEFLARFLQIFETIWEPLEQRQDHIAMFLSPRTCPSSFLPWFASWFELSLDPHLPEARARALLAEAMEIYRWRGTKYGLARVIEVCTGIRPEITERPSERHVFHVGVRLPKGAGSEVLMDLRNLIDTHKPAHTGYVLEVQR
jgi:phage tail-like protein